MERVVQLAFESKSLKKVSEMTGLSIKLIEKMWLDYGLRRGLAVHAE